MQSPDLERAIQAAVSTARALGLQADEAVVLQNSNKLALRLRPCDSFARVAPLSHGTARFEIDVARGLAETGAPAAAPDPRVPQTVHSADGFAITFWTYYAPVAPEVAPSDYATALRRLHCGLRGIAIEAPHLTDRVAEAADLLARPDRTPDLNDDDRAFLGALLTRLGQSITDRGAPEQLLHGEPHPGNLIGAHDGPRFIDFETGCRGPVEFDLAHAPEAVAGLYPDHDAALLGDCRALVLAMVAAWRWDVSDDFPGRDLWRTRLLRTLRAGPPWPSLHALGQLAD